MPRTTFTVAQPWSRGSRAQSDQGVSLDALVTAAAPTLPNAKNASLRVTVTVSSGRAGSVTFALGELDPTFGNHPAYLALGPTLADVLRAAHPWAAPGSPSVRRSRRRRVVLGEQRLGEAQGGGGVVKAP